MLVLTNKSKDKFKLLNKHTKHVLFLITYNSLNSKRILRYKMIGYTFSYLKTKMYSITKYLKKSWLQTFNGRVIASWDIIFCVCACISGYVHMYMCMWRLDVNLVCHSSGATHLGSFETGFSSWIWGSPVRLGRLTIKSRDLLGSNSGPKGFTDWAFS